MNNISLQQLTSKLKKEDTEDTQRLGRLKYIAWAILILLSLVLGIDTIAVGWGTDSYSTLLIIFAYMILAYVLTVYHKDYKEIDYAISTIQMLQQAVRRYNPFNVKSALIVIAMLLIDASTAVRFMEIESLQNLDWYAFFQWHIYILPVWIIAIGIGIWKWQTRTKPLRNGALSLLKELKE